MQHYVVIGIPYQDGLFHMFAVAFAQYGFFHTLKIGSKDGAVLHRWSPFPSSALRTGRATRRCTQLARIVLSPISCLCHSNHLDDGACDIPDKAPSPVAPVPMPSHSPVLVSALMPLPAGWGDEPRAVPRWRRTVRSDTLRGGGLPRVARSCAPCSNWSWGAVGHLSPERSGSAATAMVVACSR